MNQRRTPNAPDPDPGSGPRAWHWIASGIPGGDFVQGALKIAGATGAAQLVTILAAPVITRLYSPSDYGAFAVAGALLFLLSSIACLRYDNAIPLPKLDVDAAQLVVVCLVASVAVGLAVVPVLSFEDALLLDALGAAALDESVWLLPIGIVSGGALAAFVGWMIRTKSYRELATSRITQSGTTVAAQIGFGFLGTGAPGLLIGSVLGALAALAQLARATWRRSAPSFRSVTRIQVRSAANRYRRFPILSTPSIAINILGLEAPLIWMVAVYGPETGGHFALAQRIVALPIAVIAGAVGQVFFAEAARLVQEHPGELPALFKRTTRTLALIAVLPFVVGMIAAPHLFPVIFGEEWAEAGFYVAILAPSYFIQFVTWPTGGTLDVLERQDLHLAREISRLVLIGVVVLTATLVHLPSTDTVIALSATGCAINALYGFVSWRAIDRARARGWARPRRGGSASG